MRVAVFSTKAYDRQFLGAAADGHDLELVWLEPRLDVVTAPLAQGAEAVCVFVNDDVSRPVVEALGGLGVRGIAVRAAGYNNVDLDACAEHGITVVRVPAYSPHAVAEHTLGLVLCLNRQIHRASNRVREGNFALDGLVGSDLHGRVAGVVGTGKIGALVARLFSAFGCRVLAYDPYPNADLAADGVEYVDLDSLLAESDIISLNTPLTRETHHLLNRDRLARVKPGVLVVNTGRGALIDTPAIIEALKSGAVGALALDVYEEEAPLFFEDRSAQVIHDDVFSRLLTFPNVLVTAHQAFFSGDALHAIAGTTVANLDDLAAGRTSPNEVAIGVS